jgi:hypothetical protein
VTGLVQSLGRAFTFAENVEILDSVIGKELHRISLGKPCAHQDDGVRRLIDSIAVFTELARTSSIRAVCPSFHLIVYCSQRDPGPSLRQVHHFEKMVLEHTGVALRCDVREKLSRGRSAHDRYLLTTQCCVGLPGGCDLVYTELRKGKPKKRWFPNKHFQFHSLVSVMQASDGSSLSDVQRDLRRYREAPPYVQRRISGRGSRNASRK